MAKYYYETPASYQEKITSAIYWEAPEDNSDQVERSGYRTIEMQVREMQLAGERLEDWRNAVYPEGINYNEMQSTPVFMDQLDVIDRYNDLQEKRKKHAKAMEIEYLNQIEIAKKEEEAKNAPPPEPQKVIIVEK
ncbi:MAG: hypothetical protein [Microvirus sp.]|nr:MAG: hypothetical protein [Microvirus sp.]